MVPARLRVLIHGRAAGDWNMAVDEVVAAGDGGFPYTLRLYGWRRPTVSVGYAQPVAQGYDAALARRWGVDLVRRRTGGRAVLHEDELTYALSGPADRGPFADGIHATYRAIAAGLVAGLERLGVQVELVRGRGRSGRRDADDRGACFASRSLYEVVARGHKLIGSAQRRDGRRVLQHGSLPLGRPQPRRWAVLGPGGARAATMSVGLVELLGHRPGWRRLAASLAAGIARELGLEPLSRPLSVAEVRACRRAQRRYRDPGFLYRR